MLRTFYPAFFSYKIKNKDSRNTMPDRPHTYFIFPVIYLDQKVTAFPVYAAFTSWYALSISGLPSTVRANRFSL